VTPQFASNQLEVIRMKQVEEQAKENVRATSSKGVVVRPWESTDPRKKGCLKEAEGIIRGDAKKAGEGVIQDGKERSGR
jgi:hypothetical protein